MKNLKNRQYRIPAKLYDAALMLSRHCEKMLDCPGCCFHAKKTEGQPAGATQFNRCILTRWELPEDWQENVLIRKESTCKS